MRPHDLHARAVSYRQWIAEEKRLDESMEAGRRFIEDLARGARRPARRAAPADLRRRREADHEGAMTETPPTIPFRPQPSAGNRRGPVGGVSLRRQADRSSAPPRDPEGEERGLPVRSGEAIVVVPVRWLHVADLRGLGSVEWLPDVSRYGADRAEHVKLLAAVAQAKRSRAAVPGEVADAERAALQSAFDKGDTKNGAPRPDAAKLVRQADEKLALAQANVVKWADSVLGRVIAEADDLLAENEGEQAIAREAQEQAQRALDEATARLRAAQRMEIWTRSTIAEPSTTVGVPVWSALEQAPYPKAKPRGGV